MNWELEMLGWVLAVTFAALFVNEWWACRQIVALYRKATKKPDDAQIARDDYANGRTVNIDEWLDELWENTA